MKTRRTVSNISYNTPEFFRQKVTELVSRRVIDWCYWIQHQPDTDETKEHIHFVLHPSGNTDTFDLRHEFMEFDPSHPNKPLTCTTQFRFTPDNNMDDWLLYAVHDAGYLASKGQKRNIQYRFEDLQATDEDALRYAWNNIDRTKFDRLARLSQAVADGMTWTAVVTSGNIVPMPQYSAYHDLYNRLVGLGERSGRNLAHENPSDITYQAIDKDGVVISQDTEEIAGQLEIATGYRFVGSLTVEEIEDVMSGMTFDVPEDGDANRKT